MYSILELAKFRLVNDILLFLWSMIIFCSLDSLLPLFEPIFALVFVDKLPQIFL